MTDEILKYGNFISTGINHNKDKIVLCHSSRDGLEYLNALKFRYHGKNTKIPHFYISKHGKVLSLLDGQDTSFFFQEDHMNQKSIVIVLENLGWLNKEKLNNFHINWIGNIYKGKVFEKKWRDYFFWEPYNDDQVKSCAKLCQFLTNKFEINKKCVGHNTKIDGIENYKGIMTKSNLSLDYTDLSPAFNFELFIKYLENE